MKISKSELEDETEFLIKVSNVLQKTLDELSDNLFLKEEELVTFRKLTYESFSDYDKAEFNQITTEDEMMARRILAKRKHYKTLYQIRNNPYFASFVYHDDVNSYKIYMALTYLKDDKYDNILYDWRAPICSLFYDYEVGPCQYEVDNVVYKGYLDKKRQYKIQDNKLIHVFDNSLNIDDELLQDVLATSDDDKMKNIVNTIQKEQNMVIRNMEDKNLIVDGIAGSGKTSVALHRIAFLLYRIDNLNANNILIFSPNNIFSEYISNVLPELGEENTKETTFSDYLSYFLREFTNIESFSSFISRYYKNKESDYEFIKYKQSKEIINDLNDYLSEIGLDFKVLNDIKIDKFTDVDKDDVNYLLTSKFDRFPLFQRLDEVSSYLSLKYFYKEKKMKSSIRKIIKENMKMEFNLKKIYLNFFKSKYTKYKRDVKLAKILNYDDALLISYIKGYLYGFPYNSEIREVVIDEAQDYNYLQYFIIKNMFKRADFTILGDINQNINPYHKYDSLNELSELFIDSKYIQLEKTYRSSKEIVEYTNKILNLNHVNAIKKSNHKDVVIRNNIVDIKKMLLKDIDYLKSSYKSLAIITKEENEAIKIYEMLKDDVKISILLEDSKNFIKDLVVLPSYIAKGLEFDSVIIIDFDHTFKMSKYLYYVGCTRAREELFVYE